GAAVSTAFVIASAGRSIHDGIVQGVTKDSRQDVQVTSVDMGNNVNVDAAIPPPVLDALGRIPGVAAVDRGADLLVGHERGRLVGVMASDYPSLRASIIVGTKDRARFDRGEVVIGPSLARTRHLRPGSTLELDTPTGIARVRVQGVWQNGNFNGRNVAMPMRTMTALYGPEPTSYLSLVPAPGVGTAELAARVRAAHLDRNLRVYT